MKCDLQVLCSELSASIGSKPPKSPDNSWIVSTVPAMALELFPQCSPGTGLAVVMEMRTTINQATNYLNS
jgi:hypothetical protein